MNVLFINTENSYEISSNLEKYKLKDIGEKVIFIFGSNSLILPKLSKIKT